MTNLRDDRWMNGRTNVDGGGRADRGSTRLSSVGAGCLQGRIGVVPCLMRFNPKANIGGGRVTDVRGGGGGGGMGNIPIGGITGGGIGTTIVVIIIYVIVQFAGGGGVSSGGPAETTDRYDQCRTGADANNNADCARKAVELSLESYWSKTLPQQTGTPFRPTQVV